MVSPCCSRKKSTEITENALKTSSPGQKPLAKRSFYLDLTNQHIANRLQTQIKDLGGKIEFCLVKDVSCLITDKEGWLSSKGGSSRNPQDVSANGSPRCAPKTGRPKNRADAMLERAGCQPAIVCNDPLDAARKWGISVWSVEKAFTWLDKVQLQLAASSNKKKVRVFQLKRPFVKFEAFDRKTRPVFKEIRNWPSLNWKGSAGNTAFVCRSQDERNMTRKTRINRDTLQQPGYCEVCRIEYSRLEKHLQSETHQKFVNNNANFIGLDDLINEGTGIESFLKTHCGEDKMCDSDGEYSPPQTRRKLVNRSSIGEKVRRLPLSPTSGEFGGHRLRSRTQVNYVISTPTEEDFPVKPEGAKETRELRSSAKLIKMVEDNTEKAATPETWDSGRPKRACTVENETDLWNRPKRTCTSDHDKWDSGRPKRSCTIESDSPSHPRPKRSCTLMDQSREVTRAKEETGRSLRSCINKKRASADERLVVDNRTYYKVEVMNSKLRSSGVGVRESDIRRPKTPIPEEGAVDDKGLIVKFRKIRNSELTFLNSEAENFLFPRKEGPSSEGDPDADGPNTTVSTANNDSTTLLSSERDDNGKASARIKMEEDHSMDSNCSDSSAKKKRRRTHAEAFILDNQKYYKFETPGSRLRYQGSLIPLAGDKKTPQKGNGECAKVSKDSSPPDSSEKTSEDSECIKLEDLQFCFERVPIIEPWYESFRRQDRGEEHYYAMADPAEGNFLLPYQLPPLPPLNPKVCISAYQVRKKLLESMSASTSVSSEKTASKEDEDSKTSTATTDTGSVQSELGRLVDEQKPKKRGPKKKRMLVQSSRNPRKSPRQHASTLAILSSLVQHRRRKGPNKSDSSELSESKQSLPAIPEEPKEPEPDYKQLIDDIDKMLTEAWDKVEQEAEPADDEGISLHYDLDVIEYLEEYDRKKEEIGWGVGSSKRGRKSKGASKRPAARKRKKNRTGWPNNKSCKRHRRKDEEDSTESLSVRSENDENNELDSKTSNGSHRVRSVRNDSSDNCAEVVVASDNAQMECVNVDLEKWESAEKLLTAKLSSELSPVVRVEKLDDEAVKRRRLRNVSVSSGPRRRKRGKGRARQSSPRSPRVLRKPRGRWYRER